MKMCGEELSLFKAWHTAINYLFLDWQPKKSFVTADIKKASNHIKFLWLIYNKTLKTHLASMALQVIHLFFSKSLEITHHLPGSEPMELLYIESNYWWGSWLNIVYSDWQRAPMVLLTATQGPSNCRDQELNSVLSAGKVCTLGLSCIPAPPPPTIPSLWL